MSSLEIKTLNRNIESYIIDSTVPYSKVKNYISFFERFGFVYNKNLIILNDFPYSGTIKTNPNKAYMEFINKGRICFDRLYNVFDSNRYNSKSFQHFINHEISHFIEANKLQLKEVDFALYVNNIPLHHIKREIEARYIQHRLFDSCDDNFCDSNIFNIVTSLTSLQSRIDIKSVSKNSYSLSKEDTLEYYKDELMEYYFNKIKPKWNASAALDKFADNAKYLFDNGILNCVR